MECSLFSCPGCLAHFFPQVLLGGEGRLKCRTRWKTPAKPSAFSISSSTGRDEHKASLPSPRRTDEGTVMARRVKKREQTNKFPRATNTLLSTFWCTFAHSVHFTLAVNVSKSCPLVSWIEWQEVNFCNSSSCLIRIKQINHQKEEYAIWNNTDNKQSHNKLHSASEGVMPPQLPAPATHAELCVRLLQPIRSGSLLRRGVTTSVVGGSRGFKASKQRSRFAVQFERSAQIKSVKSFNPWSRSTELVHPSSIAGADPVKWKQFRGAIFDACRLRYFANVRQSLKHVQSMLRSLILRTTPSVVVYTKNGDRLVGQIAKRQAVVNLENTFFSVKRFIGRKMAEVDEESKQVSYNVIRDENGNVKLDCPAIGKQFAAEEISAQVLRKLVNAFFVCPRPKGVARQYSSMTVWMHSAFIRASKEILDLETELSLIRSLLSTQATLVHNLADQPAGICYECKDIVSNIVDNDPLSNSFLNGMLNHNPSAFVQPQFFLAECC
nr:stromal 70 kDa heat shock-related protein, chloroplastic [Ipomoea batatas]